MLKERLDLNVDLTFETAVEQRIRLHNFIKKFAAQHSDNGSENDSENEIIINLSQVKRSDSAGLALMVDALRLGRGLKKKDFI